MHTSFRRSVWLLAATSAFAVPFTPAPAAACGACTCNVPSGAQPQSLGDDAPLNVRFLVALEGADAEGITWTDTDGVSVSFDVLPTDGSGGEVWLVPREHLAADTDYRIEGTSADPVLFHTGSIVDLTPPAAAAPSATPIDGPSSACGAFSGARIEWDEVTDDHEPIGYDPVVRLDVEQGEDSVTLYSSASNLFPGRSVDLASPGNDESSTCWGRLALPFGTAGDTLTVVATIYDAAGNAVAWSPFEVTLGESPGASCPDGDPSAQRGGGMCSLDPATPGKRGPAWGWLTGLLLLASTPAWRTARRRPS